MHYPIIQVVCFEEAAEFGGVLLVAINSEAGTRRRAVCHDIRLKCRDKLAAFR